MFGNRRDSIHTPLFSSCLVVYEYRWFESFDLIPSSVNVLHVSFYSDEQEIDSLCLHVFIVMTQIAILHMLDLHLNILDRLGGCQTRYGLFLDFI